MEHLYQKVAYLKGLAEGLGIGEETKEGKLLLRMMDVMEEFADSIVELSRGQEDLEDYVESFEGEMSDLDDYDDYEEYDEEEGLHYVELKCPSCGEEVAIDEDLLYDEDKDIYCPNCDEIIIHAEEEGCCCSDGEDSDCCCSDGGQGCGCEE